MKYITDDPTLGFVQRVSKERTPWAVICPVHGQVFLTEQEYDHQMNKANALWMCPICPPYLSKNVTWDDDNYEMDWIDDENV